MTLLMRKAVNINSNIGLAVIAVMLITACSDENNQASEVSEKTQATATQTQPVAENNTQGSANVFVHLFEWGWQDVAEECESFLGPHGYAAVQVSPPQEHVQGPEWWTRYQPVSYKIESRGGTRAEFADMVERCKVAGVDVYADALTNHMAGLGSGTGVGGSEYSSYNYPVPYEFDDFHHCGRNGDNSIANYQDLWEVQTCNLGTLTDLDTANPEVQKKIAAYLQDLLNLGVAGFRLDAVKHVSHQEVSEYLAFLDEVPFLFQEVIDRGGEPINAMEYLINGHVTEFKYPIAMLEAFEEGQLGLLSDLDTRAGFLPADKAVVFVDNHDLQRGHAGSEDILNYKSGEYYDLANVFMLAWPYGYPKVMSSYEFKNDQQGPPTNRPVENAVCTVGWVCEHRRPSRTGMVGFRKATAGAPVTNWQAFGDELISFGRGNKGHVIINISDETVQGSFSTGLPGGAYCNVVSAGATENACAGSMVMVGADGILQVSVAPMSAIAIHN
ncbi:MAG: ATPase [Xanthomonadales bacterium]|nr:ATPase [Xanthomonadales bacterium]